MLIELDQCPGLNIMHAVGDFEVVDGHQLLTAVEKMLHELLLLFKVTAPAGGDNE